MAGIILQQTFPSHEFLTFLKKTAIFYDVGCFYSNYENISVFIFVDLNIFYNIISAYPHSSMVKDHTFTFFRTLPLFYFIYYIFLNIKLYSFYIFVY